MSEKRSKSKAEYNANATDGDKDGFVQDGTEFERPEGYVLGAVDGDGDGLVQDGTAHERPVSEANVLPPVPPKKKPSGPVIPSDLGEGVVVSMSRLVFENMFTKNSMSVIAVQARLVELGYGVAGNDRQGWLSDNTVEALKAYQKDNKLTGENPVSEETVVALFAGTPVEVTP